MDSDQRFTIRIAVQEHGQLAVKKSSTIPKKESTPSRYKWMKHESGNVRMQEKMNELQLLTECSGTCIIVAGCSGCGKSTLVKAFARHSDDNGLLVIHLGEQIDSKMLLGTYTSTTTPGEFVWLPGILTKAVVSGKWVLLEDIDCAPPDVVSLLLPLVKTRQLIVPGYCEPILAAPDFKLFMTLRLSKEGERLQSSLGGLLDVLHCHSAVLKLPSYSYQDVKEILSLEHSNLQSLLERLAHISCEFGIHLRHLLKLCERVSPQVDKGRISSVEDLMLELIDCFAGYQCAEKRTSVAMELRSLCGGMSKEKVEQLCLAHKPSLNVSPSTVTIGRAYLYRKTSEQPRVCFAHTQSSLRLLECIGRCVQMNEPVLLVGETGVGKTATVDYLAKITGVKLVVVNMSQQTDSTDLLGGFKPVQVAHLVAPAREEFERLFHATFSIKQNVHFLSSIQSSFIKQKWKKLLKLMLHSLESALKKLKSQKGGSSSTLSMQWKSLGERLKKLRRHINKPQASFAFTFVEGALVEAVRCGWWILLDEINLASPETLQCLSGLLEGTAGSFLLAEKMDTKPVERHSSFRLFCCMNPATDVGKKSLPQSIRNRFTELFVDEPQSIPDLTLIVVTYLKDMSPSSSLVDGIISLYQSLKELAESRLQDGTGRKPHYSLRTLCRALQYAASNACGTFLRTLYEGFCMSFLTELRLVYHSPVMAQIQKSLNVPNSCILANVPRPKKGECVQMEGFWLPVGSEKPELPQDYVLTESVKRNLKNLARVVSAWRHPVLLQGPTSAGKTSLIEYLAQATGHKCLRINNHEHTDLQEYVGMYTANHLGQLVFQEGVLVNAMRQGYWIILDELNLAPTDVLEALNRVLDDNRELFIAETQELVKAHPHFLLFGTQNPPGIYGGRKVLSRAFRNRFIELHYEDIPPTELIYILEQKCQLPTSYARKMVAVMKDLQQRRSFSGIFAGKYGLITLRDLFRWAERYRRSPQKEGFYDWEQQLAEDGFMLLGGRLRNPSEEVVILETIQKHFKRTVNPSVLFGYDGVMGSLASEQTLQLFLGSVPEGFTHLVWTPELLKMAVLAHRAVLFDEPVLLVGNTGCGKTTICQLFAVLMEKKLFSISCHHHTEAVDFLGGLRPVRHKTTEESDSSALFEWTDGVVVEAMNQGGCLLIDEISLAEDAVLERLNSVLEPQRKLLISERSRCEAEVYQITAQQGFIFMATMNPGGDYGKKELSPALRNRFVEIWCPCVSSRMSFQRIIEHNLKPELKTASTGTSWSLFMLEVLEWLKKATVTTSSVFSTRDLLRWVQFMNTATSSISPSEAFYHGAHLVFLDALGCGGLPTATPRQKVKDAAVAFLEQLLERQGLMLPEQKQLEDSRMSTTDDEMFGMPPFFIERGPYECLPLHSYSLEATGPHANAFHLLRAMQLGRPLLLEGAPGVGKTTLVTALAQASGHHVTRINLSEHTDISDLFGSDLPVEGGKGVQFAWRDGPFLKALKNGEWILLDEMNLASQSVLEGLNACLDHRGEMFIPELGMTFKVRTGTRLFACQNPLQQGGGRKGLPKSFVNRFTQVYVDALTADDFHFIASTLYPSFDPEMLKNMIYFNSRVASLVTRECGSKLWEFNLRDVLRWCQLLEKHQHPGCYNPGLFVDLIYCRRLRDGQLRRMVCSLFVEVFGCSEDSSPAVAPLGTYLHMSRRVFQVGHCVLKRGNYNTFSEDRDAPLSLLHCQIPILESLMYCVEMGWMAILVGGSCSGKCSVIHTLAQLTGHKLLEFPMNSDMDTTELLGGFEQLNLGRHCTNLASVALDAAVVLQASLMKQLASESSESDLPLHQCATTLATAVSTLASKFSPAVCLEDAGKDDLMSLCSELKETLEQLQSISYTYRMPLPNDLDEVTSEVNKLIKRAQESDSAGQFEWVDSILTRALKTGQWVLISNANFCNPSVLDRLNPLLEPSGVLTVDEQGIVGDSVPTISPHPDFRLFLTMDPAHGEISRAMRNRGIELYFLPEKKLPHEDWLSLLSAHGISDPLVCSQLVDACYDVTAFNPRKMLTTAKCYQHLRLVDTMLSPEEVLQKAMVASGGSWRPPFMSDVNESVLTLVKHDPLLVLDYVLCPGGATVHRDIIPVLQCLNVQRGRKLQSELKYDSKELAKLSAALQIFACTVTWEDHQLRATVLEHLLSLLQSQPDSAVETKAWITGLKAMVESSEALQILQELRNTDASFAGPVVVTFDPHISCMVDKRTSTIFSGAERISLLGRITTLHSLVEEHSCRYRPERSILQLSRQLSAGELPLENLPHPSLLHLHNFVCVLLEMFSTLLSSDQLTSTRFVLKDLQKNADWISMFIRRCSGSVYSLTSVAVAWNLFSQECLKPFLSILETCSDMLVLHTLLDQLAALSDVVSQSRLFAAIRNGLGCPRPPPSHEVLALKSAVFQRDSVLKLDQNTMAPFFLFDEYATESRRVLMAALCGEQTLPAGQLGAEIDELERLAGHAKSCPLLSLPPALAASAIHPAVHCLKNELLGILSGGSLNQIGGQALLEYGLRLTLIGISELEPLNLFQSYCSFDKETQSNLLKSQLPQLVECCCTGFSVCSPVLPTLLETGEWDGVPPMLVESTCSWMCFHLLITFGDSTMHSHLASPPGLTIGNHCAKMGELQVLLQYLWLHGCSELYSPAENISQELKLTEKLLKSVMTAIKKALVEEMRSEQCQEELSKEVDSEDPIKSIARICTIAAELSPHPCIPHAWKKIEQHLTDLGEELVSVQNLLNCKRLNFDIQAELSALCLLNTAKVHLGIAQSLLLLPTPVDPVAMSATVFECYSELAYQSQCTAEAVDSHYSVMIGKSILQESKSCTTTDITSDSVTPLPSSGLPEFVSAILERKQEWEERLEKVPSASFSRLEAAKYSTLVHVCTDLMQTVCSPERMESLLTSAGFCGSDSVTLQKIISWAKATSAAVNILKEEYTSFSDIVQPFAMALSQLLSGINSLSWIGRQSVPNKMSVLEVVKLLVQFPFFTPANHGYLTWLKALITIARCGVQGISSEVQTAIQKRIIHIAVGASLICIQSISEISLPWLEVIASLLELCWALWHQADEHVRRKAMEEETLYRYKVKVHCISDSEEAVEKEELEKFFPSYDKEFFPDEEATQYEEEMETECTENIGIAAVDATSGIPAEQEPSGSQFSTEDMELIASLYLLMWSKSYKTRFASRPLVLVQPAEGAYQLAGHLARMTDSLPGGNLDYCLMGGHARMCHLLLNTLRRDSTYKESSNFNIYKDPSVLEARKALPVLTALTTRVEELLVEWPDHPGLKQITKACEKVLALGIREPLMKILSGLEFVLRKAQDWEAYASSRVSLFKELEALTQLILEWRKMELNSWNCLLTVCFGEVRALAAKWWFHLYSLCRAETNADGQFDVEEFTVSMQKFMETSTLGEFLYRLHVLDAFRMELLQKGSTGTTDVLTNVFCFYSQFLQAVEKAIEQQAVPLEKEFKEYLSILRWNDGNYWALKATTEKSHRTLVKFMNKYKGILQLPARPILTDTNLKNNQIAEETSPSDESRLQCLLDAMKLESYIAELDSKSSSLSGVEVSIPLGGEIIGISVVDAAHKMKNFVRRFAHDDYCSRWSVALDELAGEVIQTTAELQSTEFLKGLEGDKRKSAIKLSKVHKRKAVGDLFKALKRQGLSYRKGVESSVDFRISAFMLPCTELVSSSTPVSELWEDMQKCFYHCLARMVCLQAAIGTPSKELNVGEISRCKGYASHLMTTVCEQRTTLADAMENQTQLWHTLQRFKILMEDTVAFTVSTEEYQQWQSTLCACLEQCLESVAEFQELVATMPGELDFSQTPLTRDLLPPITSSGDKSLAHRALSMLQSQLPILKELHVAAVKREKQWARIPHHFVAVSERTLLRNGYESVQTFSCTILEVLQLIMGDQSSLGMMEFLGALQTQLNATFQRFSEWADTVERVSDSVMVGQSSGVEVPERITTVVTKMLLAVQAVMKRHHSNSSAFEGVENEEGEIDFAYCKNLHATASQNLKEFKTAEILLELNTILAGEDARGMLPVIFSLVNQYAYFHKKLLVDLMMAHYALCRLLSVLLLMFAILASQGFCTPPEVEETEEPSGATDFVDIEAGGFDEGEGTKNVSSEAEPNNLDAGQSQQQESGDQSQQQQDEEAIEMPEDFDGTLEDVEGGQEGESEESEEEGEEDFDKKMGGLGGEDSEQLDRKMWAPEEEEEQVDSSEKGGGTAVEEETEIVAKDDSQNHSESGELHQKKEGEPQKDLEEEEEEREGEVPLNADYQQPSTPVEEEEYEMAGLGDLNLDEGEGDSEGDEAAEEEPQEVQPSSPGEEERSEGEGEEVQGEGELPQVSKEEQEQQGKENDKAYATQTMDMTSSTGVEPTAADNSMEPNTVSEEKTQKPEDVAEGQYSSAVAATSGGAITETSATCLETGPQPEKILSRRRPHSRAPEEATLAENKERAIKRPRLMDTLPLHPDTMQQRQQKMESSLYQHIREGERGKEHDAVAWDAAPMEYTGFPHKPEGDSESEEEAGEDMDTTDQQESVAPTASDKPFPQVTPEVSVTDSHLEHVEETDGEMDGQDVKQGHQPEEEEHHAAESFYAVGDLQFLEQKQLIDEDAVRESLKSAVAVLHSEQQSLDASELWLKYEQLTFQLSQMLCEELRLILQPTKAAQLKGDFRTGKRLNMRRIIPYIASNFQNDRIWLRRTKPSKREYQILIAVDDSSSMNENDCNQMAYESLALISNALSRLDCGQLGVCRFGESVEILHPLDRPFTTHAGSFILQHLAFSQSKTNFVQLLQAAHSLFTQSMAYSRRRTSLDINQLLVVLSDGRGVFADGTLTMELGIRKLNELGVFTVFIVLDSLSKDSIIDIKVPTFIPGKPPIIKSYLETFPFPFYIVLRDVKTLPVVLGQALRQWFELVSNRAASR